MKDRHESAIKFMFLKLNVVEKEKVMCSDIKITHLDYQEIGKLVCKKLKNKNCIQIYRHLDGLNVNAKFSADKLYRFTLDIKSTQNDGKTVCAIMQNPSYANEFISDKSVYILERLVLQGNIPQFNNVSRLIIVNLFAYIQTNDFNDSSDERKEENNTYIVEAIEKSDIVLKAWGVDYYEERRDYICSLLSKDKSKIVYRTKKHPAVGSISESFIEKDKTLFNERNLR
jgi:hypothetical protein